MSNLNIVELLLDYIDEFKDKLLKEIRDNIKKDKGHRNCSNL